MKSIVPLLEAAPAQQTLFDLASPLQLAPGFPGPLPRRGPYARPRGPIVADACLSSNRKYRYWLRRQWAPRLPFVLWVSLFPGFSDGSDADREPVVRRITSWSWRWGFGGLLFASIYPLCASSEASVMVWRQRRRPVPAPVLTGAREAAHAARALHCTVRVAAWGMLTPEQRADLDRWLEAFGGKPPSWCLGTTAAGDPLHPSSRGSSRVMLDAELQPFTYPIGVG